MRLIGIDPGLASLGWAVVEREGTRLTLVARGCIATAPSDGSDETRAADIAARVYRVLADHPVAPVVMERWVHHGQGEATTAYAVGLAVGAVRAVCALRSVPVRDGMRAQDWRGALGLARTATKAMAQERVRAILGLAEVIRPQHANDAAAVAIAALASARPLAARAAPAAGSVRVSGRPKGDKAPARRPSARGGGAL